MSGSIWETEMRFVAMTMNVTGLTHREIRALLDEMGYSASLTVRRHDCAT
jgi:hypothetical protein